MTCGRRLLRWTEDASYERYVVNGWNLSEIDKAARLTKHETCP